MNRRMKLLILVLLTAVLCLCAALAAAARRRNSELPPADSGAENAGSFQLFVEGGLFGVRSSGGRVLVEPTWYSLREMGGDILIARKQTDDGTRSGLIRANGEQLVPFIYAGFEQKMPDLWVAYYDENSGRKNHLYRSDGTLWSDTAWDSVEPDGDMLTLTTGRNTVTAQYTGSRLIRTAWHSEHPVGTNSLIMDLGREALSALPEPDTLLQLGRAAANYLTYLMIDETLLDSALFSGENPAAVTVAGRYRNCALIKAEITRVRSRKSAGFPTYLVQMAVSYRRTDENGESTVIETSMLLDISRNAAGAFTYSGFYDPQIAASGQIR